MERDGRGRGGRKKRSEVGRWRRKRWVKTVRPNNTKDGGDGFGTRASM